MQALKHLLRVGLLIALALIASAISSSAAVYAQGGGQNPTIYKGLGPFVFKGDLRRLPKANLSRRPKFRLPAPAPLLLGRAPGGPRDSLTRPFKPSTKMPAPIQTFGGPSNVDPPDTNGVVGPNHYIQIINSVFTIYDKGGNLLSGPTSLTALFAASPATGTPCDYEFDVDPVVLYDQIADRFVITNLTPTSFDVNNNTVGPYYECIAVSKTSNPVNGGWYKYVLTADATILNDYPKLGVWPDAYYMSANMGGCCGDGSFVRVWALDRNSILSGGALTAQAFTVTSGYNSLLPENMLGFQQPSWVNRTSLRRWITTITTLSICGTFMWIGETHLLRPSGWGAGTLRTTPSRWRRTRT